MSVTLKLADADAKMAAKLIAQVAAYAKTVLGDKESVPALKAIEHYLNTSERVKQAEEIAAAFDVATRANTSLGR